MSQKRLAAVRKVLESDEEMARWYDEQHQLTIKNFDIENVTRYGVDGLGEIADQIIADGEEAGILSQGESRD